MVAHVSLVGKERNAVKVCISDQRKITGKTELKSVTKNHDVLYLSSEMLVA